MTRQLSVLYKAAAVMRSDTETNQTFILGTKTQENF